MMRKRGQVKKIHGDTAVVKTLSLKTVGGCCGGFSCRSSEEFEVRNLCGAREGDWIIFETEEDKRKNRVTVLILGTFTAFLFGACLVQVVLKALGWTVPQEIIPFSLCFGLAAGASALASFLVFFRKHPLKPAAASQVIPAPGDNLEEKICLL
jgi:hypothetical protein